MATYRYVGPADEHDDVPRYGFDGGVLFPPRLAELIAAGHVERVDAPAEPEPAPAPAPEPEEPPKTTAAPTRRASVRPSRPQPPKRSR